MRNFSPVSEMRKGQRSWGEFWREIQEAKQTWRNTKAITFEPIIASATLKAVSLQLNGMLMMRKIQQAMRDDAIWAARIHPALFMCSYGKMSSPFPDIPVGKPEFSGTEPVRPLTWTHRKFYKGFRGKARFRKPGQPGQPDSCEEALSFFCVWLLAFLTWLACPWYKRILTFKRDQKDSLI